MLHLFKGWLGEGAVRLGLHLNLPEGVYRSFHNIIVPAQNGTTQVDHVLVSAFGIFVIETKALKGWIFGSPSDRQWCQVIFGRKFRFQNPLHQNYRHIKCLQEFLGLSEQSFHSVVLFVGDCRFKTPMPGNVLTSGLRTYISGFQRILLSESQLHGICGRLEALRADPALNKHAHLRSLELRHNSSTICPKCGSSLKQRIAKKGKFAGQEFVGCSGYPRCKFTRKIAPSPSPQIRDHSSNGDSVFSRIWRLLTGT